MEVASRASSSSSSSSSSDSGSGGQAEVSSSNVRVPTPYPVQMVPAAESDEDSEMDVFAPPEECNIDCIRATADSRTRRCRHGCRYCRHCKGMTERDVFCECKNS